MQVGRMYARLLAWCAWAELHGKQWSDFPSVDPYANSATNQLFINCD